MAQKESPASTLCQSCGLCCTGHLFIWTKLRSVEMNSIQSLGVQVFREPNQRGFNQPCPLWDEVCTIYTLPQYPKFCGTYKCKLLQQVMDEVLPLPSALEVVQQTKSLIDELKLSLPDSPNPNFRERMETCLDHSGTEPTLRGKIKELLERYETVFGVTIP